MRVKTFRGENMAAALAMIRQELGKDAVILGTQSVREDGKTLCEVMAALEHPAAPPLPRPAPGRAARDMTTPGNGQAAPAGDGRRCAGEKGHGPEHRHGRRG